MGVAYRCIVIVVSKMRSMFVVSKMRSLFILLLSRDPAFRCCRSTEILVIIEVVVVHLVGHDRTPKRGVLSRRIFRSIKS